MNTLSSNSTDHEFRLNIGETLADRYVIQKVIGTGGMGSVYQAKDLHFPKVDKLVAIKELFIRTTDTEIRKTIIQNFEREANILAMLDHPAIPKIFDTYTSDTRSYLILELIKGENLESIISSTPDFFPLENVLRWAVEICDVLEYLHKHKPLPIIFRDLKPSNIMVNDQGKIVLIDFGIARPFQVGSKGTMIGTEGYSSPEQYRGDASVRTDIYSLGATLHHIISRNDPRNEAPFSFSDRLICDFNPDVPKEIEAVINKALHYDPDSRHASIKEFRSAIVSAAATAKIDLETYSSEATSTSNRFKPTLDTVWSFKTKDEVRGSAIEAEGRVIFGSYDGSLYNLDAATGDFLWEYQCGGGISAAPLVHKSIVFIGSANDQLNAIELRSGRPIWTHNTTGPIHTSMIRINDGIVFGCDDGYVRNVNLLTGELIWKFDAVNKVRSTPAFIDNNIYFGSESGEVFCLNAKGQVNWKSKTKRGVQSTPLIDSDQVYVSSKDSFLYCFDANSGWLIWRALLDKPSVSSPICDQNSIYLGVTSGALISFNKKTGKEQWRFNAKGQINSKPLFANDHLFFTAIDGSLYCLDINNGALVWEHAINAPLTSSPIYHDGMILFGSTDHSFYAIKANGKK